MWTCLKGFTHGFFSAPPDRRSFSNRPSMTTSPLFLGLDVGTQSLRAALFDTQGVCRGYATTPLDTFHPQPGWAEQDAGQWWQAACHAVPAALARAEATSD